MDENWTKIKYLAEMNNGILTTMQVENNGIPRSVIKNFLDAGKLALVRKGLYILQDGLIDEYALIQAQSSKVIYSYGTALYLWGMTDRTPHIIDITAPHGHNLNRIYGKQPDLRFHYVVKKYYDIGITETETPQGAQVRLYDPERCICDLIRDKDCQDLQLFTQAIQSYFKHKPNCRKLVKYGKQFGIEEKIRTYMEVLS